MSEPETRRRRPPLACTLCRSRKMRCDRGSPCNNCVKSRNGKCTYVNYPARAPPQQQLGRGRISGLASVSANGDSQCLTPISSISRSSTVLSGPSGAAILTSTRPSTPGSQSFNPDVSMERRVRQLEDHLSKITQKSTGASFSTADSNAETTTSPFGESFSVYKTRMYGQSHWFNGISLFKDLFEGAEPHLGQDAFNVFTSMQKCKSLAKTIKTQRAPSWDPQPRTDLPPKETADELVDCYLRTSESVHRVLHLPSFKRDYDALWEPESEPDPVFIVQVKLVLAIGAVSYDEKFSLRAWAIHWIHEAQKSFSNPVSKMQLNIRSLQAQLLLLLARETVNVGGELVWISAGSLLRTAVYMGLHRDPTHLVEGSMLAAEMRRRLWNTLLEVNLQASMLSGGPSFISLDDFDTAPPGNFDDEQLTAEVPVSKQAEDFTQVSIAIALRKTFPLRLAVAKFMNDLGPRSTYEQTLRLDKELRASYKILRQTLQGYKSSSGALPSQFEIRVVDIIMNHYLMSLHIPYLTPAMHDTGYAYSRKVVMETSLKIWCIAHPSTSIAAAHRSREASAPDRDDLARLTVCGSGIFRTFAFQASLMIAVELKTQMQEEESVGPVPLRPDLFAVLNDAKAWSIRCVEAGETNIKNYLLLSIVTAQLEGLVQALEKAQLSEQLMATVEVAQVKCVAILQEMAARIYADGGVTEIDPPSEGTPLVPEDWDFSTWDDMLNFGDSEPMGWLFNNGARQDAVF